MKFKIGDCVTQEEIVIEADTIEEIQEEANYEVLRRGWSEPYSMKIRDDE